MRRNRHVGADFGYDPDNLTMQELISKPTYCWEGYCDYCEKRSMKSEVKFRWDHNCTIVHRNKAYCPDCLKKNLTHKLRWVRKKLFDQEIFDVVSNHEIAEKIRKKRYSLAKRIRILNS